MSDRQFYIVENKVISLLMPFAAVQAKIDAGWDDYILLHGDGPPWKRMADYGLKKTPVAPPPPPVPAPVMAPPPVAPQAPPRFFYAWINNAASPRMSEAELLKLLAGGFAGHVILEGEQQWHLPVHYGLAVPAPPPAPAPVTAPVATTNAMPGLPATVTTLQQAAPAVQPGQQQTLFPGLGGPTVLSQLKEFSKKPGCEDYKNDSARIDLLILYIWVRQITGVGFQAFLDNFVSLADFSEDNRKHPEHVLAYHCPRNAKVATSRSVTQWTAKEVADFSALYIEYLRGCEANGTPAQSFDVFLGTNAAAYLAGSLKHPDMPAEPGKKGTKGSFSQTAAVRPTTAGQRVIYTMGNGRQLRGLTEGSIVLSGDKQYIDVKADGGELFQSVTIDHLVLIDAPAVQLPPDANGHAKGVLEEQTLWIPKAAVFNVRQALGLPMAMGNVGLGDVIYPYSHGFGGNFEAAIEIVNGETGPYVDARLVQTVGGEDVCSLPPRKNIEGDYPFEIPEGVLLLHVKVRE